MTEPRDPEDYETLHKQLADHPKPWWPKDHTALNEFTDKLYSLVVDLAGFPAHWRFSQAMHDLLATRPTTLPGWEGLPSPATTCFGLPFEIVDDGFGLYADSQQLAALVEPDDVTSKKD